MHRFLFFIALVLFSISLFSQNNVKADTLIDHESGNSFYMNKEKTLLISANEKRAILWKTNAVNDISEKQIFGKIKIATICSFGFTTDKTIPGTGVIVLWYSDHSFCRLDKTSGKIIWCWRD